MATFTTGDEASTAALAVVDARLQTIESDSSYALWQEWIKERAIAQQALGAGGGGGSSSITTNTSIEYNTGAATSKTQRVAIVSGQLVPAFTLSAINLGAVNAATLKASAGAVYAIKVTNKNASIRYFHVVNKATTPTNSDSGLIVDVIAIPPSSIVIIDSSYFGATGLVCGTGVSWAFSSTDTTITLATAGDVISTVGYL